MAIVSYIIKSFFRESKRRFKYVLAIINQSKLRQVLSYGGVVVVVGGLTALTAFLAPGQQSDTYAAIGTAEVTVVFRSATGHSSHKDPGCQSPRGASCWNIGNVDVPPITGVSDSTLTIPMIAYCDDPGHAFPKPYSGKINITVTANSYTNSDGVSITDYSISSERFLTPGSSPSNQYIRFAGFLSTENPAYFQPVATSLVPDSSRHTAVGQEVKDTINIRTADASGALVSAAKAKDIWPYHYTDNNARLYRSARYCVYATGPYDTPRTRKPSGNDTSDSKYFEGNTTGDPRWGSETITTPNSLNSYIESKGGAGNECLGTGAMDVPGECNSDNANCAGKDFVVTFENSPNWDPGYYHFVTAIKGSMNKQMTEDSCIASYGNTSYRPRTRGRADSSESSGWLSKPWYASPGQSYDDLSASLKDQWLNFCTGEFYEPDGNDDEEGGEITGQTNEATSEKILFNGVNNDSKLTMWYSPFAEESETAVRQFQPYATSEVQQKYVTPGQPLRDVLTYKAARSIEEANNNENEDKSKNSFWLKNENGNGEYAPVNFCVTAYGPYQNSQNRIQNTPTSGTGATSGTLASSIPDRSSKRKQTICHEAKGPGTGNYDFNTTGWTPGFYYLVTTVNKSNGHYDDYISSSISGAKNQSSSTRNLIAGNWISEFNPDKEGEWAISPFQPFVTSKVNHTFIDDISTNNHTITDVIKSHAASSLANANAGNGNDSYWLDNVSVRVCVRAWGPYQQAQPYGTAQVALPSTNVPLPITSPIAIICSDGTGISGTGGSVAGGNFTGANQERSFVFNTSSWNPGYYYFTEHIAKNDIAQDKRELVIGDWHSKFNPGDQDEATIEKFQIKPTSQASTPSSVSDPTHGTIKTGIDSVETKSDVIPVLKPEDAYIEDTFDVRAYDANSPTDTIANSKPEYWLKDRNGKFITFEVCATVYGPYQQPQGAGNANGSAARMPANGLGQPTAPSIPNAYDGSNGIKKQCFWTNGSASASTTNGLVSKPTEDGGPGTYKLRWNNQGSNYFKPGYYYIVWNVDATAGGANDHNTWVDIGPGNVVNQRNGEFLESSWWSPFGEQSESFYSPFQPIAKSTIPEFADGASTATSGRKRSSVNGGDGGIVMTCDENQYANLINYTDNPEEFPKEKLHCRNVVDRIWLGAVDNTAIDRSTHEVDSKDNNDNYWPKDKNGNFEQVKFQVKLYGPFKYPYSRIPADNNKAGWVGTNEVTVVPKSTDGKSVEAAQNIYGQPIAQSCVIAAPGPSWNDKLEAIDAVFTQDVSGCQGGTPADNTIELTPGFYVSVVEIVRDDINSPNPDFAVTECDPSKILLSNRASNPRCATQIMTRPHNMIIEDRFTSAWGDLRETLLVPVPLYIVTRRDNSAQDTFVDQVTIDDQYWVAGFSSEYVGEDGKKHPWTDIWGESIPAYGDYDGKEGYVATSVPGILPTTSSKELKYEYKASGVEDYYLYDTPSDIYVKLYGPYPLEQGRPSENDEYCAPNRLVPKGTWRLPAEDTGPLGSGLPYPSPLTLYEKGWYVYQYTFSGGDRITDIKTQCGDTSEMFRIIKNEIGLVTTAGSDEKYAPTRITDTVQVTGSFQDSDKGSIVKLDLYKQKGPVKDPGAGGTDGAPLCTVIFTVNAAGVYTTADYVDDKGYMLGGTQGSGRCFAEDGGHYYWIEEFLFPGSDPLNPNPSDYIQPIGTGDAPENIDILPPPTPEVITDADPATSVNKPFRDMATVTNIPEGNTKKYYLWFTAYGPYADGHVNCSNQLIYSNESSPITVTKNGQYYSDYITVPSTGIVYWVEHLRDEDGNIVDEGECGTRRENTYVIDTPPPSMTPFDPFQVIPSYPDAGYISQQMGKVVALGMMSMIGAWQLTNKNSWLLRKR
jgi:hypothetical protein